VAEVLELVGALSSLSTWCNKLQTKTLYILKFKHTEE
jgi:hypothetical protein